MIRRLVLAIVASSSLACAGVPYQAPIPVSPIRPGVDERLLVDDVVLIFDASGAAGGEGAFPAGKALLESLVASMPDGGYDAGAIAFGGDSRQVYELGVFQRAGLEEYARSVSYLGRDAPLPAVLAEAATSLEGRGDRAAVVLISQGRPDDESGRALPDELSLAAASGLAVQYEGEVCFHSVQLGEDPAGAALLGALANVSACGTRRDAASLQNAAALEGFAREVFFGPGAAATPGNR